VVEKLALCSIFFRSANNFMGVREVAASIWEALFLSFSTGFKKLVVYAVGALLATLFLKGFASFGGFFISGTLLPNLLIGLNWVVLRRLALRLRLFDC
jgi:hypothetical protein